MEVSKALNESTTLVCYKMLAEMVKTDCHWTNLMDCQTNGTYMDHFYHMELKDGLKQYRKEWYNAKYKTKVVI